MQYYLFLVTLVPDVKTETQNYNIQCNVVFFLVTLVPDVGLALWNLRPNQS